MLEGSRLRLVSALGAPALGVVGAMSVVSWAAGLGGESELLRRLLAPEGESWLRVVPGAIVFLLIWALADLAVKSIAIMRARRSVAVARSLRGCPVEEARRKATAVAEASWPLLRSLGTRVGEVFAGHDADRSYAQFRHECEIEAERGAGSYGLVRLLIWAMPILGFIGTVIGIGDAVSEFAGFLTGDIEDVEVVKTQLSNVSTGLSFAFDTTLLGLSASLVSMVAVSLVQRQEESLLSDVEQAGFTLLETRDEATHSQVATSVTEDAEKLADTLHALAQGFREQTQALAEASQRLQNEMAPLRASIDSHAQRAVGAGVPRELLDSVTSLRESSRQMLEASRLLTSAAGGRRTEERRRPEPRELRVARPVEGVSAARAQEPAELRFEKPTRDPFWRAPWTSGGAEIRAQASENEPDDDDVATDEVEAPDGDRVHVVGSPRNRLAVMWGFGLLFMGTGSVVVAGWLVDRVLIPPDFALVALIVGATFWSMGALSAEQ